MTEQERWEVYMLWWEGAGSSKERQRIVAEENTSTRESTACLAIYIQTNSEIGNRILLLQY